MNRYNNISKMLLAAIAMLTLATSTFAIPKGPCDPKPDPTICCEEPPAGPFAFSYAKDIGLSCPRDFYLDGTFLLMQAREDGLEYAIKQNQCGTGETLGQFPIQDGTVMGYNTGDKSLDWNYGLRIAAGFYLNHDAWDLQAAWTYFRINNDKGIHVNGGALLPLWLNNDITLAGDNSTASARWTGDLNSLDLRLGKPYHVSRYVIFNPHFGVRFAHISQDYMARYGGDYTSISLASLGTDNGIDMVAENNFWGFGARTGIDTEWHVGSGWYLFGNLAASLLYSHFDVEQSIDFNHVKQAEFNHDFYTVTPNTEVKLGLCWNKRLCCNKYLIRVTAAYEFHAWFNQNRMRKFFGNPAQNDAVSRGDLFLSGFAFNVGFEF